MHVEEDIKFHKMIAILFLFALANIVSADVKIGQIILSDNFNRSNDPTILGQCDQGYQWLFGYPNNPAIPINIFDNVPGILNNSLLYVTGTNARRVFLSNAVKLKNFELEYDFLTNGSYKYRGIQCAFRCAYDGQIPAYNSGVPGYMLHISQADAATLNVYFYSFYNNTLIDTNVIIGQLGAHIRVLAVNESIKVYVSDIDEQEILVIDHTETIAAANEGGRFIFMAGATQLTQGIDNLVIKEAWEEDAVIGADDEDVLFSDNFGRPDRGTDLGYTDQGSNWQRRIIGDTSDPAVVPNDPGISGGAMIWSGDSDYVYPLYVNQVRDFTLEFDYIRATTFYPNASEELRGLIINTRMSVRHASISDEAIDKGVRVIIYQASTTSLGVGILEPYITPTYSTQPIETGGLGGHVKIIAKDDNYKIYIVDQGDDEVLAMDYIVTSSNPAFDEPGYINFYANPTRIQGIDNVICRILPEGCGDIGTVYLAGDINKDCKVDFKDLASIALNWQNCTDPQGDCNKWWD